MDLKKAGNLIYLIGVTHNEMGGSHYAVVNGLTGGAVPRVNLTSAPKIFQAVHNSIEGRKIRSCHDLSEGGLAIAAAEMAFAGGLGIELDLSNVTHAVECTTSAALLFSESATRFLVEVEPQNAAAFEAGFEGLPLSRIGSVTDSGRVRVTSGKNVVIDLGCTELKAAWQKPLAWE